MKSTQYAVIGKLIQRKTGATPRELMFATGSTCVHKRLSELKERGWHIERKPVKGKSYGTYHGKAPK